MHHPGPTFCRHQAIRHQVAGSRAPPPLEAARLIGQRSGRRDRAALKRPDATLQDCGGGHVLPIAVRTHRGPARGASAHGPRARPVDCPARQGTAAHQELRLHPFQYRLDQKGPFYFRKGKALARWRDFRVRNEAQPGTRRHAREISLPALANIVLYRQEQGGSSMLAGLCEDVARLVGMQRVTADAENRISEALTSLIDGNHVILSGHTYMFAQIT